MATPTLDEIEARVSARRDEPANTNALTCDAVLALVAHVRALDKATQMTSAVQSVVVDRIAALEAKVATLGNDVARMREDMPPPGGGK